MSEIYNIIIIFCMLSILLYMELYHTNRYDENISYKVRIKAEMMSDCYFDKRYCLDELLY